jgi:hypothetical protein
MFNQPLEEDCEIDKDGEAKDPVNSMHIIRDADPRDIHVLIRGDVNNKGPLAPRRFLQILSEDGDRFADGSGRRQLAEAIVAANNPLTARVFVNRLWGLHFGQPLVATPSNFGQLGAQPSHPRLLDDLAVRFVESGWSIKNLQRELVLSATYRQSSQGSPAAVDLDPANKLLGRMNRKRLTIEAWRDAVLSFAGNLSNSIGGRSLDPQSPDESRRTVYSRISRLELDAILALFDYPDPNAHSARRVETTTPLQKLFVMNSEFMVRQAERLAGRILRQSESEPERIQFAYELVFGRLPHPEESRLSLNFVQSTPATDDFGAWQQYAQALLAANELLIID